MNKISLYPLFVGLIISSQLYANNEIVITGNVVDSTCVLTPADVNGSNSGNGNIAVVLNNVLAQDFTETNTEQGSKEFTLKLSDTNGNACDAVTSAQLTGMTLTANTPVVGSTGVALNEAYSEENPVNIMIKHNDTPVDLTGAVAIVIGSEGEGIGGPGAVHELDDVPETGPIDGLKGRVLDNVPKTGMPEDFAILMAVSVVALVLLTVVLVTEKKKERQNNRLNR